MSTTCECPRRRPARWPDAETSGRSQCRRTVKVLLVSLDQPIEKAPKLNKLIGRRRHALVAHPSLLPPDDPATAPLRQVLGGLQTTAIGVLELRNNVGTGHGQIAGPDLTGSSLGRLAVDAVSTYCAAMLSLHAQHFQRTGW